jgi:hypothetical protein
MDRIKMGFVNGFFNLAVLSMLCGIIAVFIQITKRRYKGGADRAFLIITLFSVLYTWASLCISRDHLHLVLGMPPSYILLSYMIWNGAEKMSSILIRKGRNNSVARKFSTLIFCIIPLIFICYFGFLTALKNEGFRSVSPALVNMDMKLDSERARGIIVTEKDMKMIDGIVSYINEHTDSGERIFDTSKRHMFYFLSDRVHASFYYILHPDAFRPDKQGDVLEDIKRRKVNLIIADADKWDNAVYYMDKGNNPLSFEILGYIISNYAVSKKFDRYYILERRAELL